MKRIHALGSILAGGLAVVAVSAQRGSPLPPAGRIEHVRGPLYKIFGGGGNTTVFVTDHGVVLVDTKVPNNGQAILDQVRTVTDKPVSMIINTHNHPDHNGSNDFFKAQTPTIEVVAQENLKQWATGPRANPAMMPTRTFKDRLTLGAGKDAIDLYYFGRAHTDNDALIVFRAVKAMCIGDMMAWKMAPLIDPGSNGSVTALPDTMEKVAKGIRGVDLVIEGHGDVNTWQGMVAMGRFDRDLLTAARKAYDRRDTPDAAVAELAANPKNAVYLGTALLPGLEYGNTPKARALMNVNVAFQEMAGEKVTTNFGGALPETDKHKGGSDPVKAFGVPPGGARGR